MHTIPKFTPAFYVVFLSKASKFKSDALCPRGFQPYGLSFLATSVRLYIFFVWLLCASSIVLLIIIVVVTTRSSTEQLLELVEFNLARAILVHFADQLLDVNRHLELLLDGSDEHVSIYTATTVFVATHRNICVEQIGSRCAFLVFSLRGNQLLELVKAQRTNVVGVRLRNHAENLLV